MKEQELFNNLTKLINKLDPFNMMIYNESDIYQKEVKLILQKKNIINNGIIKDIFKITFFEYINDEHCNILTNYIINNRPVIYNYIFF